MQRNSFIMNKAVVLILLLFCFGKLSAQSESKLDRVPSKVFVLKYPLSIYSPLIRKYKNNVYDIIEAERGITPNSTICTYLGFMPSIERGHYIANWLINSSRIEEGSAAKISFTWRRYFGVKNISQAKGFYFGGGLGYLGTYNTLTDGTIFNRHLAPLHIQVGYQINYKRLYFNLPLQLGCMYHRLPNMGRRYLFTNELRFSLGCRLF